MSKSKLSILQPASCKPSAFNLIDESVVTEWLAKYGKTALYILGSLVFLSLIIYRFSAGYTAHGEREYLSAANNFAQFETSSAENKDAALAELTAQLTAMPELQAAYGAPIAQTLLSRAKTEEAAPFINATLKRTQSDNLPYYADFGATSLLIAQTHYQAALDRAAALQKNMLADLEANAGAEPVSFGSSLFAFNTLRIALLHQQLGQEQEELNAWKEFERYAGLASTAPSHPAVAPQAFHRLIQQLAVGNITLMDYMLLRQKTLEKS